MANKVNRDAFKRLKKILPKKTEPVKLQQAFERPVVQSMLGLLTPTQFAELFPRYYQQALPDVGAVPPCHFGVITVPSIVTTLL